MKLYILQSELFAVLSSVFNAFLQVFHCISKCWMNCLVQVLCTLPSLWVRFRVVVYMSSCRVRSTVGWWLLDSLSGFSLRHTLEPTLVSEILEMAHDMAWIRSLMGGRLCGSWNFLLPIIKLFGGRVPDALLIILSEVPHSILCLIIRILWDITVRLVLLSEALLGCLILCSLNRFDWNLSLLLGLWVQSAYLLW